MFGCVQFDAVIGFVRGRQFELMTMLKCFVKLTFVLKVVQHV